MNTNNQLKPCPFCGGKAHVFVENGVSVICPKCRARSKILVDSIYDHKVSGCAVDAVVEAWNRRANDND